MSELTDRFVALMDLALTSYGQLMQAQREGLAVDPLLLNTARAATHQVGAEMRLLTTMFTRAVESAELALATPEGAA